MPEVLNPGRNGKIRSDAYVATVRLEDADDVQPCEKKMPNVPLGGNQPLKELLNLTIQIHLSHVRNVLL